MVELLVVIAIITVLIGFLLPAVMKVRAAAMRIQCMNNIRQCTLALHHYSDSHGSLPALDGSNTNLGFSMMLHLLPYVEEEPFYRLCVESGNYTSSRTIRLYLCPADPTVNWSEKKSNLASYAANACAFSKPAKLDSTFTDGTSQTIAFAEHYAHLCQDTQFGWFDYTPDRMVISPEFTLYVHRASFAEYLTLKTFKNEPFPPDVHAVTMGQPPTSIGSVPSLTFQVRPTMRDCNARLAQTPHATGMVVAMVDGSVRTLAAGMAPAVYWGMVTPAGGEVIDER